jgi:tetratricopeptide (TPR) repeat protein
MLKKFLYAVCVLLILAIVGYYIYEVAYLAVPFQQNLFRAVLIVAGLVATMVKLATGTAGRSRSLAFYEKMYAEETAGAFENSPALRKKLVKGIRLFQENQPHKALKIFASLSQKCETRADFRAVYLFHALSLTSMGNHYGAIEVYERAVRLVPDYGRFYSNLGFAYMQTKNTEKAIENYERALELAPNHAPALSNLANIYFEQSRFEEAIASAEKALEAEPSFYQASTLLAIIHSINGDEENAKKYFHMAISSGQNPNDLKNAIEYYKNNGI